MAATPKHRAPIINAAVTLFRRQGYAGTGLNDIVDASGAPKGSLYHYFPKGKASIATAAIEEAGLRVARTVTDLAEETGSTAELLRAHARLLAGWMKASRFRDGCPITTVLLEMAPEDRGTHGLCSQNRHPHGQTRLGWLFPHRRCAIGRSLCLSPAGRAHPGTCRPERPPARTGRR